MYDTRHNIDYYINNDGDYTDMSVFYPPEATRDKTYKELWSMDITRDAYKATLSEPKYLYSPDPQTEFNEVDPKKVPKEVLDYYASVMEKVKVILILEND